MGGNSISSVFGQMPSTPASAGGSGGSAIGIFNPFGLILRTANMTANGNRIEQLFAAPGGLGGDGGMAVGIFSIDAINMAANTNTILNLFSGIGGIGSAGAIGGGNGTRGGFGGNNIADQGNTVQSLTAGIDAILNTCAPACPKKDMRRATGAMGESA